MIEKQEVYSIYLLLLGVTAINFLGGFVGYRIALNTHQYSKPAAQEKDLLASDNIQNLDLKIKTINDKYETTKYLSNFSDPYDVNPRAQATDTSRIPVLIYHHINKIPDNSGERLLNVSPETFNSQMDYLSSKGYKTLSVDEFLMILETNKNPIQKSVLISFDDGYQDTIDNALPILKKYGFKATWFIPVNKSEINKEGIKLLADAGMDIGSHTMTHRSMKYVTTDKERNYEVNQSVDTLQEITGKPIKAFGYPYCVYNTGSVNYIGNSGIKLAFQCGNVAGNSIDHSYVNRFLLHRSWMYNNLQNFIDRLSGIEYRPIDQPPEPNQKGFHFKVL